MSLRDAQICRLCLKVAKVEFEIDGIKKGMFEILFLKLNLEITENPIICLDCMEVGKKYLNFKYTCITTEQIILSYSADRKEAKHDIKVIYQDRENEWSVFNEDFNVCRFCMSFLGINNCFELRALMSDRLFEMLSQYMVEMDFNTIENPIACTNCKKNLDGYFKFVLNCLDMEEKIKEYCKENRTDNMGQVKLSNVLLSMCTDEYPDKTCEIEQEQTECIALEEYSGLIKREELDIKDEKTILDGTSYRNTSDINVKKLTNNMCSLCTHEAKRKSYLKKHMLVHKNISKIKMHKCPLCAYETKRKDVFKKHTLVHKDVSEIKMYKCSSCTYETKQKCNLKKHLLVHKDISEIKTHKCSLCAYQAKQKTNLTKHMLVHKDVSEVKMYRCSLCGYETKRKRCLQDHTLAHKDVSEIKMYKCSLCTYEAKHKTYLKKHMLVHKDISEIKTYKCSLCAYKAKRKSDLKGHILVHKDVSQLKMSKCSLCTYKAKQKKLLKAHMLVHKQVSQIEMYRCSSCPYESKRKYTLIRHMRVHRTC